MRIDILRYLPPVSNGNYYRGYIRTFDKAGLWFKLHGYSIYIHVVVIVLNCFRLTLIGWRVCRLGQSFPFFPLNDILPMYAPAAV